jgi:hypothetical protein
MSIASRILSPVRSRLGSFLAGLGALASPWPSAAEYDLAPRSDLEVLRGDFRRVGSDMQRVMDREHARLEAAGR